MKAPAASAKAQREPQSSDGDEGSFTGALGSSSAGASAVSGGGAGGESTTAAKTKEPKAKKRASADGAPALRAPPHIGRSRPVGSWLPLPPGKRQPGETSEASCVKPEVEAAASQQEGKRDSEGSTAGAERVRVVRSPPRAGESKVEEVAGSKWDTEEQAKEANGGLGRHPESVKAVTTESGAGEQNEREKGEPLEPAPNQQLGLEARPLTATSVPAIPAKVFAGKPGMEEEVYDREPASGLPPSSLPASGLPPSSLLSSVAEVSDDSPDHTGTPNSVKKLQLHSPALSSSSKMPGTQQLDRVDPGGPQSPAASKAVLETPTEYVTDGQQAQLDEIMALTMHQMVDSDSSGRRKLIFLTNHQVVRRRRWREGGTTVAIGLSTLLLALKIHTNFHSTMCVCVCVSPGGALRYEQRRQLP
jgi:hypothetical protein